MAKAKDQKAFENHVVATAASSKLGDRHDVLCEDGCGGKVGEVTHSGPNFRPGRALRGHVCLDCACDRGMPHALLLRAEIENGKKHRHLIQPGDVIRHQDHPEVFRRVVHVDELGLEVDDQDGAPSWWGHPPDLLERWTIEKGNGKPHRGRMTHVPGTEGMAPAAIE